MQQTILSMSNWLATSKETRLKLRELFHIAKSKGTEVENGRVVCDGTTQMDLQALTLEKMQKYLNSVSTDFHLLFQTVVNKIEHPELEVKEDKTERLEEDAKIETMPEKETVVEKIIKKVKNAKKSK